MLGAARVERVGHQAGIVGAGKRDAVARERHHVELGVLHDLEHALVLENGLQQIERVAQGNLRDRIAAEIETVARAMAMMTRFHYRHLPVVERGKLMGIISIGDLVNHRVREMELETGVLRDRVIARH